MEKYHNKYCKYCTKKAVLNFAEVLKCSTCNKYIHITCLKRQSVPGGIFGDTFFDLTCQECSESGNEIFVREKMTWFQVIILIMYHIQNKTAGTANKGFYHWRVHLVTFIDKKWNNLFSKDVKRRKNWMGTVSGSLSHFSPCFFTSGTSILGSNGWWKLTFPELTPTSSILIYNEITTSKQSTLKAFTDIIHIKTLICKYLPKLVSLTKDDDDADGDDDGIIQGYDEKMYRFMDDIDVEIEDDLKLTPCKLFDASNSNTILHHDLKINQVLDDVTPVSKNLIKFSYKKKPDFQFLKPRTYLKHSKSNFYKFWRNHERQFQHKNVSNVAPLRIIEENTLHNYIMHHKCEQRSELALKRKLHVRYLKRKHFLQTVNMDEIDKETARTIRTRHYTSTGTSTSTNTSKEERVMARGQIREKECFISPYTNRLLKPFIRRDKAPKSVWLALMAELTAKQSLHHDIEWTSASLDYVYVRPNHIPVINSLCEQYFWPGVDMSEALECPEFSVVVLYKKLIVAFGFMVPEIHFNETYISFIFTRPEWRRAGIATFMIYHLIQTCMGKDITLHVAIDNPAIFLYQKFGFKVEQVILNFYDTYLRDDSNQCKHAFFLRLER